VATYDSIISRSDADALIPVEQATQVLQTAIEQSAALRLFPHVPMSSKQRRIPVVSALPVAYFVNGDTGLKQTTEVNWSGLFLEAEEIAAIVPIPEAVVDDASFDVWGMIQPRLAEAVGRTLDAAIFFGLNKPASWPQGIVAAATAAGNVFARGTNTAAEGGISADISDLFGVVEADGYAVDGLVAKRALAGLLRNARDANGVLLSEVSGGTIYGVPIVYAMDGLWPTPATGAAEAVAGDFTQGMLGVRQDLTYKLLDQAVISDDTGKIIYNLAQQDMVAMRVVARFGFQVANPISYQAPTAGTRYPFAVLTQP
jgi:HK97 family phage major capsid protein